MKTQKILLVDDHEIFRNGVKQLIEKEHGFEVIGGTDSGYEAITLAEQHQPDIVLMDISMPSLSGLDTAQELLRKHPDIRIIFLSLYDRDDYILKALDMGAYGYLLKDESNKDFIKAIRNVSKGRYYFSGDTSHVIIGSIRNQTLKKPANRTESTEDYHLSKRETQILNNIAQGMNNKDLSQAFTLSVRTIESHRQNILRKLRVNNIEQAILIAKSEKIIE